MLLRKDQALKDQEILKDEALKTGRWLLDRLHTLTLSIQSNKNDFFNFFLVEMLIDGIITGENALKYEVTLLTSKVLSDI